jgi:hypothetical protein
MLRRGWSVEIYDVFDARSFGPLGTCSLFGWGLGPSQVCCRNFVLSTTSTRKR